MTLPNSRMANYTVGENGNVAIAFRGKEIMIYNEKGELIKHIKIKDCEPFFIAYRKKTNFIDVFFLRNNSGILMTEEGEIVEKYSYEYEEIKNIKKTSGKSTQKNEKYTYKMRSSYRFPVTTYSTRLVQIDNESGVEIIIYDNGWVSIVESIGLLLVIVVVLIIFIVIISKLGVLLLKLCKK